MLEWSETTKIVDKIANTSALVDEDQPKFAAENSTFILFEY